VTHHVRTTAAVVTSTALAMSLLAIVAPAGHAGTLPATVGTYPLTGATAPNSITAAHGHIFVADSNSVLVYNEDGSPATAIAGVFGAKALTPSADGTSVFAAQTSGSIAVIDTTTLTKGTDIAVAPYPVTSLAVVGNGLYYAYSTGGSTGEINHVDLTTITAHDIAAPDATGLVDAPKMAVDNGRLITLDDSGTLRSWSADNTGLTDPKTGDAGFTGSSTVADIAAGGGRLAVVSMTGYNFQMFNSNTLALITTLPAAAYPESVGVAPNGTIVGTTMFGGTDPNTTKSFWFYDPATGVNTGSAPQPGGWGAYSEQAGGVAFNGTGTIAYTLANTYDKGYYILAASLVTPASRTVKVAVTNPARYGYATKFSVTGTPNTVAAVTIHNNGTGANTTVNVAIGSTGIATYYRALPYSGTVTATVAADVTHTGFTSAAAYRVPSLMTVSMSKPAKIVSGIYYYVRATSAKQTAAIKAAMNGRAVYANLYRMRVGSRTWARVQTAVLLTTSTGAVYTYMALMAKGYYYKITYTFKGDTLNGASAGATKTFRLS
jgi:hypothetical protein